jgi:hypothetical protein
MWHCFLLTPCLAFSSTLKMEAISSSETSVDFHRATRRYIPEDIILHDHRCENLKLFLVARSQVKRKGVSILCLRAICPFLRHGSHSSHRNHGSCGATVSRVTAAAMVTTVAKVQYGRHGKICCRFGFLLGLLFDSERKLS